MSFINIIFLQQSLPCWWPNPQRENCQKKTETCKFFNKMSIILSYPYLSYHDISSYPISSHLISSHLIKQYRDCTIIVTTISTRQAMVLFTQELSVLHNITPPLPFPLNSVFSLALALALALICVLCSQFFYLHRYCLSVSNFFAPSLENNAHVFRVV